MSTSAQLSADITASDPDLIQKNLQIHFDQTMARRGADVRFDRFETATTDSDGITLHLDVIEVDAAQPTLVFFPGTAVYGLTFGDFLAELADQNLNVVSVDPRGHGRSAGIRGRYTVPDLVADARAAIAYAKSRFGAPVFLAGSSQGGLVAFYTAATDEELAGVICHNVADLADPGNAELTAHPIIAKILKPILQGAAAMFPNASFNIQRYFSLLSSGDQTVKDRMAADPLALKVVTLGALASLSSAPLPRPVEEISTPVMIVHGGMDTIFPQALIEGVYQRLSCEKTLKVYPDRDHFLFTENVSQVVPDITAWIHERCS